MHLCLMLLERVPFAASTRLAAPSRWTIWWGSSSRLKLSWSKMTMNLRPIQNGRIAWPSWPPQEISRDSKTAAASETACSYPGQFTCCVRAQASDVVVPTDAGVDHTGHPHRSWSRRSDNHFCRLCCDRPQPTLVVAVDLGLRNSMVRRFDGREPRALSSDRTSCVWLFY